MRDKPEIVKLLREEESSGKLNKVIRRIKNEEEPVSKNLANNYNLNSKQTLQLLINLIDDPVVIVDKKGNFLEVSNRVEDLTGVKREQLLGTNFMKAKFITAKSKTILISKLAKRMLGDKLEKYEIEAINKDGDKVILAVNGVKIHYNEKPADLVIFHDISIQKKTEEALKISENKWQHLVENIPDIIMTVNRSGKILSINRVVEGLDATQVIGKNLREYESSDYHQIREKAMEKVLQTGKPATYEMLGYGSDGKCNAWYETRIIPAKYEEQNETLILMSRDITERKVAAQKLQEKLVELEKFQKVSVDRELKMIELKKEINELCKKLGEKLRYDIEEDWVENEVVQ